MPEYRFYPIGQDGHIHKPPTSQELPDDAEALKEAKKLVNGCDIEVWQKKRLVAYLIPEDK